MFVFEGPKFARIGSKNIVSYLKIRHGDRSDRLCCANKI